MKRTRIKICGITRAEDARGAAALGADAIGLVFYPPSPRFLTPGQALEVARAVPPFVTRVALFVNESEEAIRRVLASVPVDCLQFHGEETEAECARYGRPYLKVARVRPGLDLLEYARSFPSAQGLLLDAWVEAYGGAGQRFDWSLIPAALPLPLVLSGGLTADTVGQAVRGLRPWAVDVSSGVESSAGVKDARKMAEFIAAVRAADGC
ncbi:MAG: phosphoribosylanthranilate isomerase [Rhodocyclaceae bacterium]